MARSIVPNSQSNLNLSPRQAKLLEELILAGAQMARTLKQLDKQFPLPAYSSKPADRWAMALMRLAESLL